MQMYFPSLYDIKYLMKFCDNLHGGLNKLAECLDVSRIGPQHQVLKLSSVRCLELCFACRQDSMTSSPNVALLPNLALVTRLWHSLFVKKPRCMLAHFGGPSADTSASPHFQCSV